jgi:ribosome biogenesis GTPase A
LLVLNKADLADEDQTKCWIMAFESAGIRAIALNSMKTADTNILKRECVAVCADKIERALQKGRLIRPVRAMVAGIPNTGKSTLINTLSKKKVAIVSDRPGVTRVPQWIRAGDQLELMDMPGVLWPRIDHRQERILLAATGAIRDAVIDKVEVAYEMFCIIARLYPQNLNDRYGIDPITHFGYETFEEAAKKRGCVLSGGRIDEERFASVFLDEIRSGIAGKMTYESPDTERKKTTNEEF